MDEPVSLERIRNIGIMAHIMQVTVRRTYAVFCILHRMGEVHDGNAVWTGWCKSGREDYDYLCCNHLLRRSSDKYYRYSRACGFYHRSRAFFESSTVQLPCSIRLEA